MRTRWGSQRLFTNHSCGLSACVIGDWVSYRYYTIEVLFFVFQYFIITVLIDKRDMRVINEDWVSEVKIFERDHLFRLQTGTVVLGLFTSTRYVHCNWKYSQITTSSILPDSDIPNKTASSWRCWKLCLQDTVVALQALTEFLAPTTGTGSSNVQQLSISLLANNGNSYSFQTITATNSLVLQTIEVSEGIVGRRVDTDNENSRKAKYNITALFDYKRFMHRPYLWNNNIGI